MTNSIDWKLLVSPASGAQRQRFDFELCPHGSKPVPSSAGPELTHLFLEGKRRGSYHLMPGLWQVVGEGAGRRAWSSTGWFSISPFSLAPKWLSIFEELAGRRMEATSFHAKKEVSVPRGNRGGSQWPHFPILQEGRSPGATQTPARPGQGVLLLQVKREHSPAYQPLLQGDQLSTTRRLGSLGDPCPSLLQHPPLHSGGGRWPLKQPGGRLSLGESGKTDEALRDAGITNEKSFHAYPLWAETCHELATNENWFLAIKNQWSIAPSSQKSPPPKNTLGTSSYYDGFMVKPFW